MQSSILSSKLNLNEWQLDTEVVYGNIYITAAARTAVVTTSSNNIREIFTNLYVLAVDFRDGESQFPAYIIYLLSGRASSVFLLLFSFLFDCISKIRERKKKAHWYGNICDDHAHFSSTNAGPPFPHQAGRNNIQMKDTTAWTHRGRVASTHVHTRRTQTDTQCL